MFKITNFWNNVNCLYGPRSVIFENFKVDLYLHFSDSWNHVLFILFLNSIIWKFYDPFNNYYYFTSFEMKWRFSFILLPCILSLLTFLCYCLKGLLLSAFVQLAAIINSFMLYLLHFIMFFLYESLYVLIINISSLCIQ